MVNNKDNAAAMSQEMQHIIEHAQALVEATSGEVDDRIKAARTALQERLATTRGEVDALEDRLLETLECADKFIHVKPYYAIGSTFVAGLFLGWFMSRK